MSSYRTPQLARVILAGAIVLLVVHTLGRFIYTPMLPLLIADGYLTVQQGADVATWNYIGYLVGAMLAIRWSSVAQIQRTLPMALAVNVLCTLLQTQAESFAMLAFLRLISGISNGLVFVQAPALILEWLVRKGRASTSGLMFLGIGAGLIFSSVLVSSTAGWLVGPQRWWPAFIASVPLAWWGWRQLAQLDIPPFAAADKEAAPPSSKLLDGASIPLFLAYAGGGLGYILPMTFLPTLVAEMPDVPAFLHSGNWMLVALATLPSPWLWNKAGVLMGDAPALRLNYALQAMGVLAVLVLPSGWGVVLCSLLVGATFVGTVLLTLRIARALQPHQGPRLSAALVALYGITQLLGPWLTKLWLNAGGTLQSAFWLGAGALLWGFLWALKVPNSASV